MTIAAILALQGREVISIPISATAAAAVALLADRRIGALPVMDGDSVVGVFSERDMLYSVARDGAAALERPVAELMTHPPVTIAPGDSVLDVLALMTVRRVRHLPVIDHGRMVGFVSIGDLVKYRIDRIEGEAEAMRVYIQQV